MRQSSSATNCECEKRFVSQVSSCQPQPNFTSSTGQGPPHNCSAAQTSKEVPHAAAVRQSSSDTNCECEKRFVSQVSSCQPQHNFTSSRGCSQAKVLQATAWLLRHLRRSLTRLPCDSPARTPTANVRNGSYLRSLPVSPSTTSQAAQAAHRPRSSTQLLGCSDI